MLFRSLSPWECKPREGRTCFVGHGRWTGGAQECWRLSRVCCLPPSSAAFPSVGARPAVWHCFFPLFFQILWSFEWGSLLGGSGNQGLIWGTESFKPGVWGFGRKRKGSGYQPPAFTECPVRSGPCWPTSVSIVSTINGVIPPPTLRGRMQVRALSWCLAQRSPE